MSNRLRPAGPGEDGHVGRCPPSARYRGTPLSTGFAAAHGPLRHSDRIVGLAEAKQGRARTGLAKPERADSVDLEREVIEPAVPPRLTGLEAPQEHVIGVRFMVKAGVMVLGLVAAADMAARCAHSQMHPARADLETVLAAGRPGSHVGKLVGDMRAVVGHRTRVAGLSVSFGSALVSLPPIILVM